MLNLIRCRWAACLYNPCLFFGVFLILFILLSAQNSLAGEKTVFGPQRYERTDRGPTVYTASFARCEPSSSALIKIWNGDSTNRATRLKSAKIELNGKKIFKEKDFKRKLGYLEKIVPLKGNNRLRVTLKSHRKHQDHDSREDNSRDDDDNERQHKKGHSQSHQVKDKRNYERENYERDNDDHDDHDDGHRRKKNHRMHHSEPHEKPPAAFLTIEIVGQGCDLTPPLIENPTPADHALLKAARPVIGASFTDNADGAGVDPERIKLLLDGVDITASSAITQTAINFVPLSPLVNGSHQVALQVADLAGNSSELSWSFTTDTVAPVPQISSPTDSDWFNSPTIDIFGSLDDPTASVTINGLAASVSGNSFSLAGLPLTEGSNSIILVATDPAGNSSSDSLVINLDTLAPIVTINAPLNGLLTNLSEVDVTAGVNEPIMTAAVNKLPAEIDALNVFRSAVPLTEGENRLTLTVTDRAGNSGAAIIVVNRDSLPPAPPLLNPLSSLTNQAQAVMVGHAEVGSLVHLFQEKPDGSTTRVGSAQVDVSGLFRLSGLTLTEGSNRFFATAIDAAGNEGSHSATVRVVLDTLAPLLNIDVPVLQSFTNQATSALSGSADEPLAAVRVNDLSATLSGGKFTIAAVPLTEGNNRLTVTAEDLAGNQTSVEVVVHRDTIAPMVSIASPVHGLLTNLDRVTVVGMVDEPITSAEVNGFSAVVDGQSLNLAELSLNEGVNALIVSVVDRAGNPGSAEISVTLDSIAPQPPVFDPIASPVNVATLSLQGRVEPFAQVKILRNVAATDSSQIGLVQADDKGIFVLAGVSLQEGVNRFTATATDAASNKSGSGDVLIVQRDSVPPLVTITAPEDGLLTAAATINVSGSVNEPITTLALNGKAVSFSGQSFTLADVVLVESGNRLMVTATDPAGNSGSATISVNRDSTAPVAPQLATPLSITNQPNIDLNGSAEPGSQIAIEVTHPDGNNEVLATLIVAADGNFRLTEVSLGEGISVFTALATDAAGNSSPASEVVSVERDSIAPVITVTAPAQGSVNDLLDIEVVGYIDEADASLTIDGVSVPLSEGSFTHLVSLQPGSNTLILLATDPAGNSGTTSVSIQADGTPPTVVITSPSSGTLTNQSSLTISGHVDEDNVSLTLNGQPTSISGRQFAISTTLSEGANLLSVAATDLAGNTGRAAALVQLDSQSPVVNLSGPATADAGSNLSLSLGVSDNSPIARLELQTAGAVIWSDSGDGTGSLNRSIPYTLAADLKSGDLVSLTVEAVDQAGNSAQSVLEVSIARGASGPGYLQGEVYDDSRGLLLADAKVRVMSGNLTVASLVTGDDGGYFFELEAGHYLVLVSKPGFSAVERPVTIEPERNRQALDARLTPLSEAPQRFDFNGGLLRRKLSSDSRTRALELQIPVDALMDETDLRLQLLSNQGLIAPLPPGWAPLAVWQLQALLPDTNEPDLKGSVFLSGANVSIPLPSGLNLDQDSRLILAAYEPSRQQWLARSSVVLSQDMTTAVTLVPGAGQFALVLADSVPDSPPETVFGVRLSGVAASSFNPAAVSATGKVVPYAAPPSIGLLAAGEVVIAPVAGASDRLVSGTRLNARVVEQFDLSSGESVQPPAFVQDLIFYRAPCVTNIGQGRLTADGGSGLLTTFPVSPSRDYTVVDLLMGKVGIDILPLESGTTGVMVGVDGARLIDDDGNVLAIPVGALSGTTLVQSATVAATTAAALVGSDFTLIRAVSVDLTRQTLGASATLSIPAPTGLKASLPLLLAKSVEVAGKQRLRLVGSARIAGSLIETDPLVPAQSASGAAVQLRRAGILTSGRYFILQAKSAIGYLRGTVTAAGGVSFPSALVATDSGSLIDLSEADGGYLLAAPLGPVVATALDPGKADFGQASADLPTNRTLIDLDLAIIVRPPQVLSISPATAATGVEPNVAPVINFSEAVERSSVNLASVTLQDAFGTRIAGALSFNPTGDVVTFYPEVSLVSETGYILTLDGSIRDLQGYTLGSAVTSSFTIRDTTPPPMPPAGSITASFPDADGMITVSGTQGSVEIGTTVLVINDSSGEIVGVAPQSNGSFSTSIAAQLGDQIQVVMMDEAGNQTLISYLTFKSDDGRYLVTAKGGKVAGEGGSQLDIPDGALFGPTVIKLTQVAEVELPHPIPAEAIFIGAVDLDNGGFPFQKEVKLSIPVPAGLPTDAQFFVAQPKIHVNADGSEEEVYVIIDSAKLVDGRITTASPPFAGIHGFGIFTFLMAQPSIGPVTISGTTYRDMDGNPGYHAGVDSPIEGAVIRSPGAYNFIAYSDAKGHYASYGFTANGFTANGVCRNFAVTAIYPLTMFRKQVNLTSCAAPYIVNNFNFKLADAQTKVPDTLAPEIKLSVKVADGQNAKIIAGTVLVGTELDVPVSVIDAEILSVKLQVEYKTPLMTNALSTNIPIPRILREVYRPEEGEQDPIYRYQYRPTFSGQFAGDGGSTLLLATAGTYALVVEATDQAGHKATQKVWIRAVDPGEVPNGIEGSPQVDEILPQNGTENVLVNMLISVKFSEPVKNLTDATFKLIDQETEETVPAYLTERLEEGRMVAYLAPKRNLYYDHKYEIVLTTGITDDNPNTSGPDDGNLPLDQEYRSHFKTKTPKGYRLQPEDQFAGGFDIALYNDFKGNKVYTYVTAKNNGWRVIDTTDPTLPQVVAEYNQSHSGVSWSSRGVAVDQVSGVLAISEDIRYVSSGQYGYVRFYDIYTDPVNPTLIGKEKLAEAFTGIPGHISLYGRFAYISTIGAGLQVVDIEAARKHNGGADGSSIVGTFDSIGLGYGQPWDMEIYPGGRAVLTTSLGYLLALDLTMPQIPRLITAFKPEGYSAFKVGVAPGYQFTGEDELLHEMDLVISVGHNGRLRTVDLSDPKNPVILGTAVDDKGNETQLYAMDIVVSQMAGLVYVTSFNAIEVFDIRDPYHPLRLARITALPDANGDMIPIGAIPALIEQNGWVFMADQADGMRILDLDPIAIRLTSNRVVILDKNDKALKPTLDYQIIALNETFGRVTVDIYEILKGADGQVVGERLHRTYATGSELIGSANISAEIFPKARTFYAQVIVDKGITGKEIKSVKIPFIHQAIMTPDYDHNRVIDDKDRMRAMNEDIFYFWINDDDDEGETSGTDIPGKINGLDFLSSVDSENKRVDGVRDLVDFFPLQLNLQPLLDLFPPNQFIYRLKTEAENVNIAFTDLTADEAGYYLVGDPQDIRNRGFGELKTFQVLKGKGVNLNRLEGGKEFLQRLSNEGKGILLIEGRSASTLPLQLEVADISGNKYFWTELNLSLSGVENMFRHKNLINVATKEDTPPKHGSKWGETDRLAEPQNCPDDTCLNTNGTDFVFVHGYNVDGQQARGWQSEMFKRMFWSGSKSRFWGVDWYGAQPKLSTVSLNYHQNVRNALQTAKSFNTLLNETITGQKDIAAHSLGNMLVSSALLDYGPVSGVGNVFMIDAAVPLEAYTGDLENGGAPGFSGADPRYDKDASPDVLYTDANPMVHPAWYGYAKKLGTAEWHQHFKGGTSIGGTDDKRQTLTFRNRFSTLSGANFYNFYSSGEDVLAIHTGGLKVFEDGSAALFDGGRNSWALQEKLKGRMWFNLGGSKYGGWGFSGQYATGTANQLTPTQLKTQPFFDLGQASPLIEAGGSSWAEANRDQLLAEAIPATTVAAGGKGGEVLSKSIPAFDMQTTFTNGWPQERLAKGDKRWKHSDLRNVSYLYINEIFNRMVAPAKGSQ